MRIQIGEKGIVAESQLDVALVRMEQERYSEAEQLVRQAIDQFKKEGEVDDQATAFGVLAKSLLLQDKAEQAQEAIDSALALSKKTDNWGIRFFISTTAVQVWAKMGNTAKAFNVLNSIIAECRKYGYGSAELEARLALGELQMKAGKSADGALNLSALEKEATARSYHLILLQARLS